MHPDFDDTSSYLGIGILVKQPPPIQHTAHKPPGYNTRYVGKQPITHNTGFHDTVFRPSGSSSRRDDLWIHQGISPGNEKIFSGNDDTAIMEEEILLSSNHQSSGTTGECEATCGPMEFFCSKSCSCILSDMHCGNSSINFIIEVNEKNVTIFLSFRWSN